MKHSDKKAPFGAFSVVGIMHRLEIIIFYLAEAVIKILLVTVASTSGDDTGAFPDRLAVWDTVLVFCDLHEKAPSIFL